MRCFRTFLQAIEFLCQRFWLMPALSKSACVEFYEGGSDLGCSFDLGEVRIYEQADLNPTIEHASGGFLERVEIPCCIQSPLGRQLFTLFRDDAYNVRLQTEGDFNDLRSIGHLEVEAGLDPLS